MDIVFCFNQGALGGLGATLTSMIKNCSDSSKLKIWFLINGLKVSDIENIKQLLQEEGFKGEFNFVSCDPKKKYGSFRSLHGDWMPYAILLIPEVVVSEFALYLDADLIIEIDILELKKIDLNNYSIGAANGAVIGGSLERKFFNNQGISDETAYFNSGVVLINISRWQKSGFEDYCLNINTNVSDKFLAADQTILNLFFRGDFKKLPEEYNNPYYPKSDSKKIQRAGIVHFLGSPKPWDLFGNLNKKRYDLWSGYNSQLWKNRYGGINWDKIVRAYKIKKPILKILLRR